MNIDEKYRDFIILGITINEIQFGHTEWIKTRKELVAYKPTYEMTNKPVKHHILSPIHNKYNKVAMEFLL
jgi:hypothetical protein